MYEDIYIDYSCSKKYGMIREFFSLVENFGVDVILLSIVMGGGMGIFFNIDRPFKGFSLFGLVIMLIYVFIFFVCVVKKNCC